MVISAIYDNVAERFLGIDVVQNEGVALRGFINALQAASDNPSSLFATNPADFDLYNLGQFDEHDGSISSSVSVIFRGWNFKDYVYEGDDE